MKQNKSEIIIVLDRSGSMGSIKTDIEGGFKTFLEKQKQLPGEAYVTLYQFDTEYEKVYEAKDIKSIDKIDVLPRGGTALLDALGRAIVETGERFNKMQESERPESVVVLVLTDGEENSSKEFTISKIKESVKHQQEKYNWNFVFLGANLDAVSTGAGYGLSAGSTMTFATNSVGISNTFTTLNKAVSCYRSCASYEVSDDDRKAALGEEK